MTGKQNRRWHLGAAQRIQKAKRAKNIDRYVRHKQRRNLLEKLEPANDHPVIVAPELGRPSDRLEQLEQQMLEKAALPKMKKKKRNRNPTTLGKEEDAMDTADDSLLQKPSDTLPQKDENVPMSTAGNTASASTENIPDSNTPSGGDKDPDGWTTVKKKHFPFKKEIKQREAARLEREKERLRIQSEIKARRERQEQSRRARKREGKQFRSVTRKGQPLLKHRIDGLLNQVERKFSKKE